MTCDMRHCGATLTSDDDQDPDGLICNDCYDRELAEQDAQERELDRMLR
jgi:hypothetical protein